MTTPLTQALRQFREDCGLTMQDMADALGKRKSSYQYYEESYKKSTLPRELAPALIKVAKAAGLSQDRVSALIGVPITIQASDTVDALFDPRKLPILGGARGGLKGVFADNGMKFGETMRPLSLQGVDDAYAVYVVGESMEPRYFAGEIVCIHPQKPITRNCFVLVQYEEDGERHYTIKQYLKRTETSLHLRQLNPEDEIILPVETIFSIHKAVATLDS